MFLSRRWLVLLLLLATAVCDGFLLWQVLPSVSLVAALLLVFIIPGAVLMVALPDNMRPGDAAARITLAYGFSIVISMLCFWLAAQVAGMGIINRWLIVETGLLLVLALIAVRPTRRGMEATPAGEKNPSSQRSLLASMALAVLIAACLRLPSLGYGELYDDELDVAQSARSLLLGQTSVVFEHRKGPTEIWFAAVVAGASSQMDEFTLRLPFVVASLGAIAGTVLLGEEFLGARRGLLAGLLLAGEGIFLAFSRMVQYQGIELCMIVLTAWCALRFWRAQTRRSEVFYLAGGALFWSFGALTHWDGALAALFLVYAAWKKWSASTVGSSPTLLERIGLLAQQLRERSAALGVTILAAIALPGIFYLQLFFNPKVSNLKQYAGERIGFGVYNGAPGFMLHATFYDASPFIVGLLLIVWTLLLRTLQGRTRILAALLLLPFMWPGFLTIGDWNLSIALFAAVLLIGAKSLWRDMAASFLWLWLFAYFMVYAFVVRSAGLHFYTLMPALMLLASSALPQANAAQTTIQRLQKPVLALFGLLLLLSWSYAVIAYLNTQPEYALNYPRTSLSLFPSFYPERPRDFFFGFPYRYGWSVIGALYEQGQLRGKFLTNETYLVTDWYARDIGAAESDEPRYYFRVEDAPRGGEVPKDLDEQFHVWGDVRVHGTPRIQIYESNRYMPVAARSFNADQFAATDPELLARSMVYRQTQGDDNAFRDLGRYLDKRLSDQDMIVLDTPLQDGIVPYYYEGNARIVTDLSTADAAKALSEAPAIYASLFSAGNTERWLAQHAYPVESRWFGSVRLATYAPPDTTANPVSVNARFGDVIQLSSFTQGATELRAGDVVRLGLQWQTLTTVATRYKVFVHIADSQGKMIAQRDAEPMAELTPTTTWNPGQTVVDLHGIRLPASLAPQTLSIVIGLYDPLTNERLPVHDAQGQALADAQLPVGHITIR